LASATAWSWSSWKPRVLLVLGSAGLTYVPMCGYSKYLRHIFFKSMFWAARMKLRVQFSLSSLLVASAKMWSFAMFSETVCMALLASTRRRTGFLKSSVVDEMSTNSSTTSTRRYARHYHQLHHHQLHHHQRHHHGAPATHDQLHHHHHAALRAPLPPRPQLRPPRPLHLRLAPRPQPGPPRPPQRTKQP
jgi:hypothetical protein